MKERLSKRLSKGLDRVYKSPPRFLAMQVTSSIRSLNLARDLGVLDVGQFSDQLLFRIEQLEGLLSLPDSSTHQEAYQVAMRPLIERIAPENNNGQHP